LRKWMLPFAVLFSTAAFGTNIVQNPGFELGDFTGWTAVGFTVSTGVEGVVPHSGTFYADTGCPGANCINVPTSSILQVLATTSGDTYTISFWYDLGNTFCTICTPGPPDDPSNTFAELKVLWGGVTILDATQNDLPDAGYVLFTANVLATSNSMQLQFLGRQDPAQLGVDDVCVTAFGGDCSAPIVPEPTPLLLSAAGIAALGILALRRPASAAKPNS